MNICMRLALQRCSRFNYDQAQVIVLTQNRLSGRRQTEPGLSNNNTCIFHIGYENSIAIESKKHNSSQIICYGVTQREV